METLPDTEAPRTAAPARVWLACGVLGIAAALGFYGYVSGPSRYAATGNPYPGAFTSVTEAVGYFLAVLLGAVCLGALLCVVTMSRPARDGLIDPETFGAHLVAERVSLAWMFAAAAMVAMQAAHDSGAPVADLLKGGALSDAITDSERSRGWIVATLCALVVAVSLRFTVRWVGHVVLLVPAVIAGIAVVVTGNAGQGPDHDYSTSAAIVFITALAAVAGLKAVTAFLGMSLNRAPRALAIVGEAVAILYGAVLLYLLTPETVFGSDFGLLGLAAGGLLLIALVFDCAAMFFGHKRWADSAVSALMLIGAVAAVSATAIQTAPRFLVHRFTAWDVFLGYELPQPPTVVRLLTVWRFDPLLGVLAVVLVAGYVAGFIRLRRRGDSWPAGRLVAWLAGCAVLFVTTGSGVRAYGSAMFSVHMAEHMTLNMFVPVLLVLGGPVTLALRVLPAAGEGRPPGPREWLTWLMHSRVTTFLSHPIVAFILFVASPYVVYFTPLFDTFVRYHWGHEFMAVHFLLVGYLFYWAIIGIDPGPRRLPYLARIGLLFAVMPFHAFFGIALMTTKSVVGATFYHYVNLPWLGSIASDQHLGGAIAWGATELPVIIVIIALVAQWARQDRQLASRQDRHSDSGYGDDDLDAYNAMLRELAERRRS